MELIKFEMELLNNNSEVTYKIELLNAEEELKKSELYQKVLAAKRNYENYIKSKSEFEDHIKKTMLDNNLVETTIGDYHIKIKQGRKSQAVEVIDEKVVPDDYKRIKSEVDKSKALKDLKEGIYIEGLELKDKVGDPTLEIKYIQQIKTIKEV